MSLRGSVIKFIAITTLMAFCLAVGCATIEKTKTIGGAEIVKPAAAAAPPQIIITPEAEKPLNKAVLRKGQAAPGDGIWFDKASAKIVLGDLAEFRQLKTKIEIQDQIIAAYAQQWALLRESNDLMAQSNEQMRKEIESQRKWKFWRNVLSTVAAVAAFGLGIYAAK